MVDFIAKRGLSEPDGRPLYAYQCTQVEFANLRERLAGAVPNHGVPGQRVIRGFVLYASQWWQRQYSGGPWSWGSVFQDIGWTEVHYPDLYAQVGQALVWWKVELVRLSTTRRYLGTFACQGGLPLSLVGESSRTTAYVRAVLRHVARYRSVVDDPIELARDQQHLLKPPTLRREYVFRLAADLASAVLDLRQEIGETEDLLAELDARRTEWRQSMPLDLDSETARQLLETLLHDAKSEAPGRSGFGVERFLVQTGSGWRMGARLRLPRSVEREDLGQRLRVPAVDLPPRVHVRTAGEGGQIVGLYGAGGEHFHLISGEERPSTSFWGTSAAGELRLEFLAQNDVLGEVTTHRSAPLGELPWVFRAEGDYALVGEGTVSDRAPQLLALLPPGCEPSSGEALDATIVGRDLWRIHEPAIVPTDSGKCEIKPASEQMVEEEYRLVGDRFYSLTSTCPLFRGRPNLFTSKVGAAGRLVSQNEVSWRRTGGDWQSRPDGYGLWEVRHQQGEVLRHHERVGLLPDKMSVSIAPRSASEGDLVLDGGEGVAVANDAVESHLEVDRNAGTVRLRLSAVDAVGPPAKATLRLRWPRTGELRARAPFPIAGARFVKGGEVLTDSVVAVDDLYGVRATALSSDESQRFWIEGELEAQDAVLVKRVAHFRHALRKSGTRHEMALVEVDSTLRLLLGASAAQDARVSLRIVDNVQRTHGTVKVRLFAATLRHDPSMASVVVEPHLVFPVTPTFEALPLARTDVEPVTLTSVGPPAEPVCARLPEALAFSGEPWLIVLRGDEGVLAEPAVVGGLSSDSVELPQCSLGGALASRGSRKAEAIDAALMHMVADDESGQDADWAFLNEMLLCLDGVPSSASDLISALARSPQALVRCLFRVDPNVRARIWQLDDELPFSWLLIKRETWRNETQTVFATMSRELRGIVEDPEDLATKHVLSVLLEGARHIGALDAIVADIGAMLEGGELSEDFKLLVRKERDHQRQQHVQRLALDGDWPPGYTRQDWSEVLGEPRMLKLSWDQESDHRRQPTFDTPVAAAWCCFASDPTPQTPFLVKRMRAHGPIWFDIAYQAAWYELASIQDRARKNRK